MEWLEPKTDWSDKWDGNVYVGDYFTYIDYNRIKNNLLFLNDYASSMYYVRSLDLGEDKNESDIMYADEMTKLYYETSSLCSLVLSKNNISIGIWKSWDENGRTPTAKVFNYIENYQLGAYNSLVAQKKAQNRLSFTLGGQKGFKV